MLTAQLASNCRAFASNSDGKKPPAAAQAAPSDDPVWIPADKSPWGVRVLDVRPFTHNRLSMSQNQQCAINAMSFGGDDGLSFVGQNTTSPAATACELQYKMDRVLAPGVLFTPRKMEDKWAIFFHGGRILFVRSWTRTVVGYAEVNMTQGGDRLTVTRIVGDMGVPGNQVNIVDFLIRTHCLGLQHPVILPKEFSADDHVQATAYCFSMFGHNAAFAALHGDAPGLPKPDTGAEPPLRSNSLLHIAVARNQPAEVSRLISQGIPPDLLGGDGLTPLHWALAVRGTAMLEHLVAAGCPVDARSAEGATALMNAVQSRAVAKQTKQKPESESEQKQEQEREREREQASLEQISWLLDKEADVNSADNRGFTALHRAAELGRKDVVEMLLKRGAMDSRSDGGHNATELARKSGRKDIAELIEEYYYAFGGEPAYDKARDGPWRKK